MFNAVFYTDNTGRKWLDLYEEAFTMNIDVDALIEVTGKREYPKSQAKKLLKFILRGMYQTDIAEEFCLYLEDNKYCLIKYVYELFHKYCT